MKYISYRDYGKTPDGFPVTEYTFTNINGIELKAINYGCTITSLKVPDRNGELEDIVLGFDTLDGYLQSNDYLGCIIGRFANRIADGRFSLDGKEHVVATNISPHHLHGGLKGFDKVIWFANLFEDERGTGIDFHYLSPENEEGYPGNLLVDICYFLTHDNAIIIQYRATTDKKTIINLTQHSYFNLAGGKELITNHELMINADRFLPVDDFMIPTGEIRSVEGSPFDFRKSKSIAHDLHANDIQLQIGHGYDHNWILKKAGEQPVLAATLYDPHSGRIMDVLTTEPGMQLYTGNYLNDNVPGKNNMHYSAMFGLCLETQHFPDSPHHPEFPSAELTPGEQFLSTTIWKFSAR